MPALTGFGAARELMAHLTVSKIQVEGARTLAALGDNVAAREAAGSMLDGAIAGLGRATGRDAQLIIGARVNFAQEAAGMLGTQRAAIAGGGAFAPDTLRGATAIVDRLIAHLHELGA